MRFASAVGAGAAAAVLLVTLTGCSAHTPQARLAQLDEHVVADTILPVTTGHGDRTLPTVTINRAGAQFGIEASCIGNGSVTVVAPGGDAAIGACSPTGSQQVTIVFSKVPDKSGPVTVTTSQRGAAWNATLYYVSP